MFRTRPNPSEVMSITIRQHMGDTTVIYSKIDSTDEVPPTIAAVAFDMGDWGNPRYETRDSLKESWRKFVKEELTPYGIEVSSQDTEIMDMLRPLMFEDCIHERGYELTFTRKLSGNGRPLRLGDRYARGTLKSL